MDPQTGGVRALVGGRDFDDSKFDRAVQSVRQPGSTFKPFVYADAIQNGRPLSYLLDDSPLTVQLEGSPPWTPRNFEGDYAGTLPMRRALYQSRNIPTIKLGLELGTQSVIDEARKFGLTTPIPGYPSIFIGAADVYPIEMVAAYSTFATLGTRTQPMAITRVEDSKGTVLWEPQPTRISVLSPEEAWLMVSVMKDVVQRGTAAGSVGGPDSVSGWWKNRNDERRNGRLVHRLHVGSGRGRLDGVRQATENQSERAGRNSRGTCVDCVHERDLPPQTRAA
jgi:penicillin-binding protein 1A